jgi:hypothetical protein
VGAKACSLVGLFEAFNIVEGTLAEIVKGVNKVK